MIIPTKEQLSKIYKDINPEYVSKHINRKLYLIDTEYDIISKVKSLYDEYEQYLKLIDGLPAQNKQKLISEYEKSFKDKLFNIRLNGVIDIYNKSRNSYNDVVFGEIPINETGGEQQHISKSLSIKQDIKNMVDNSLNNARTKPISKKYSKVDELRLRKRQSVDSLSQLLQEISYFAEQNNVQYDIDNFQLVYYRVEILDTNICMNCLSYDAQFSDSPLGSLHRNCRGIDIPLFKSLNDGKYYDMDMRSYTNRIRTRSFEQKFNSMSKRQQRTMLGNKNFDLFSNGKLKANDFIVNGRQITNKEAELKVKAKALKSEVNTITKANKLVKEIDNMFKKPISKMSEAELLAYEKSIGIQKQIYENLSKKAFPKSKGLDSYISKIDAKYDAINERKNKLRKEK